MLKKNDKSITRSIDFKWSRWFSEMRREKLNAVWTLEYLDRLTLGTSDEGT